MNKTEQPSREGGAAPTRRPFSAVTRAIGWILDFTLKVSGAGLLMLFVWIAVAPAIFDPYDDRSFNSASWIDGNEVVRTSMARSAARAIKTGDTSNVVAQLLGEPDWTNTVKVSVFGERFPDGTARTWGYRLNPSQLHGYDDAYLYVHLDASDFVIEAQLGGG